MKVRVINMDKDTARWKKSSTSLLEKGFVPVRFRAIDDAKTGYEGCSRSHIEVIRRFYETTNDPFVIVAEDDVIPLATANEVSDFLSTNVPSDADLVRLACLIGCSPTIQNVPEMYSRIVRGVKVEVVSNGLNRTTALVSTAMYAVTRKGARKILDDGIDHTDHIDKRIANVKDIIIYGAWPSLATYEYTGACTDSNNISTSDKHGLFCWLDKIHVGGNFSLGYVMCLPYRFGPFVFKLYEFVLILLCVFIL